MPITATGFIVLSSHSRVQNQTSLAAAACDAGSLCAFTNDVNPALRFPTIADGLTVASDVFERGRAEGPTPGTPGLLYAAGPELALVFGSLGR